MEPAQTPANPQDRGFGAAIGVFAGYLAGFAALVWQHERLVDAAGRPIVTDFLALFSAGRMALAGRAAAAYNPYVQHAAEAVVLGHNFQGDLPWPYPPQFFFLMAPLALLSYPAAFLVWTFGTMALYAWSVIAIARTKNALLLALAPPFVFGGMLIGQNGFFTAALLGTALLQIERRPIVSGILLGLLTDKPQFGILIPLVLAVNGNWRVFFSAAVTTALLLLAAGAAFGFDTISAFIAALPTSAQHTLIDGSVGWQKIQSIYGVVRCLGGSNTLGMGLQLGVTVAVAAGTIWLWRGKGSAALKAAALCVAVLCATPYVFVYDLPLLSVALAFLYRDRAFDRVEIGACVAALIPLAVYMEWTAPIAVLSILIVAAMVIRRASPTWRAGTSRQAFSHPVPSR